ncbi:MAG: transcription-repair coupling factor [Candidatus Aminicenantes bacterium]|nr:transcription-repair coupling factor [Candidatus Aminicenantes bacterium]
MSLDFLQDVPEFQALLKALERGGRPAVAGVNDSGRPYLLAMLAAHSWRRAIWLQPSDRPAGELEARIRFYLDRLGVSRSVKALPSPGENPYGGAPPSLEAVASRMRFLYDLRHRPPVIIPTDVFGLLRPLPAPERLDGLFLSLKIGMTLDRDFLIRRLAEYGYVREDLIAFRGEYAYRGGVVDAFSPWHPAPFRIEFGGDTIASLREFDPSTQRTLRKIERCVVPALTEAAEPGPEVPFTRYLDDAVIFLDSPDEVEREYREVMDDLREQAAALAASGATVEPPERYFPPGLWSDVKALALPVGELMPEEDRGREEIRFGFQPVPKFENRIPFFLEYMKRRQEERDRCLIFLSSTEIRRKVLGLLAREEIPALAVESALARPAEGEILLVLGRLDRGFAYPSQKALIFAEEDILTEDVSVPIRSSAKPSLTQFQDLKTGDFVVHADYGVGVFNGLIRMDPDGKPREFLDLCYRDGDRLCVPVEDLALIQKFTPLGAGLPSLDKLGTTGWEKTKTRTKKAVEKLAHELLELYARRKSVKGYGFSGRGPWQEEFDKTFEYEETGDQLRTIREVEEDMESDTPMDRLVCGDVGYGKTEVALRAAFKAVMDGKQVAVLCPTTVLASQHAKTFAARMVLFPVRTAALTRLQSKAEQTRVLGELKAGRVDVLIGTHRILSKDVEFKDLGLLVVDEEQRFGVSHKERIKQLRTHVDVLTLTATPIPRTLNMSLTGLRDISLIETAPRDRLAVHTVVTSFSPRLIGSAVRHELARGGQVYYILNKIEELDALAAKIAEWAPQAKVVTIHGQMAPAELEKRMLGFIEQRANVLVSTTIIENGIDIPLVNTLIVQRADHFGLAQLYQLRGRVGRSSRQAYAYFLVPPSSDLTPMARRRLDALKEFSQLGSGFRLAMKDLEIRGAGHLFGEQQSGVMEAVGYDYFIHMLEGAIKEIRGEAEPEAKAEIHLRVDNRIPETYVPQSNLRLDLYKRVSSASGLEELDAAAEEMKDRFGPPPPSVRNLLDYGRIKWLAKALQIRSVDRVESRLVLRFLPESGIKIDRVTAVLRERRGRLSPEGILDVPLPAKSDAALLSETIGVLKALYGV